MNGRYISFFLFLPTSISYTSTQIHFLLVVESDEKRDP